MAGGGGGQQQQSGGGADNSLELFWLSGFLVLAGVLIWHYAKVSITQAVFVVKGYEILSIKFCASLWLQLANWLQVYTNHYLILPSLNFSVLDDSVTFMTTNSGSIPFKSLLQLSGEVGKYIRYPIDLILIYLAYRLYFKSQSQRYKNILDMKELKVLEQANWPQIKPIVNIDLINTPLDQGKWMMALSPMKFCKQHKILKEDVDAQGRRIAILQRGPAYRLLALQLGPRWRGPEYLPIYLQALFAVFVARINNDKKTADKLILQYANSSLSGKLNTSGVADAIFKNVNTKAVQKLIAIHAYVVTAMASLLNASREAGVLATSEFIWLKTIDRRMWYMLNSVGRTTAVTEISGAFAHWLAEKKLGLPLVTPMIDEAVNGLDTALKDMLYKAEDD